MTFSCCRGTLRPSWDVRTPGHVRWLNIDSRQRLTKFWAPTGGIASEKAEQDDPHQRLIRGGFLRKAHSGVFHLLPLGLRVQNKLETLIDKHMQSIGASKLSLSSITTEQLWRKSGRYQSNSELLRVKDRNDLGFLLSPTHEEEITNLVGGLIHSYKDLPVRLYQVGRKYRDERRPRHGLLRAKEFMMKDLYTFDHSSAEALKTYELVRQAYNNLFDELKLPYVVADADSGNMGGKLSHEYHFLSSNGEDNVWSCSSCDYVANEELVEKAVPAHPIGSSRPPLVFSGISRDRTTAIEIHVPRLDDVEEDVKPDWDSVSSYVDLHAVKRAGLDVDTGVESSTLSTLLPKVTSKAVLHDRSLLGEGAKESSLDLTVTQSGDGCPRCTAGKLSVSKAIEVGHTFHLGTRYSEPLSARIAMPSGSLAEAIHMGCHGIGVSRLIGAIPSLMKDESGLQWPRAIAPFDVVILTASQASTEDGEKVYDALTSEADVILDDRPGKSVGWKLKDADLVGYPLIVTLGRRWKEHGQVEVQCRRLGVKMDVGMDLLREEVARLLEQV